MLDGRDLGFGGFTGQDPGESGRLIDAWRGLGESGQPVAGPRDPGEGGLLVAARRGPIGARVVDDVGDRADPDRPAPVDRQLGATISDLPNENEG